MLSQARLKELLDYNPETGAFVWRFARRGGRAGDIAGCASLYAHGKTYIRIRIDGVLYHAHRLAVLYTTGEFSAYVDHARGDANAATNLRPCTQSQNLANAAMRSDNTSGYKGVVKRRDCARWTAQIGAGRKNTYIGIFGTPELAARAYDAKAEELFGEFALTNAKLGLLPCLEPVS